MPTLNQVSEQQLNKAVTVNENFDAVSPAGLFGVNEALTTALTFAYYGGIIGGIGSFSTIADGTLTLTNAATNYIEATTAGVVSSNTTGFTVGRIPLYTAVTENSVITTLTDYRVSYAAFDSGPDTFTTITVATGTITTSTPGISLTQTWNAGGVTFVAQDTNITDTSSASGSLLQRWRVGGVEKASITKAGAMTLASTLTVANGAVGAPSINLGDSTTGLYRSGSNEIAVTVSGTQVTKTSSGAFSVTGTLGVTGVTTLSAAVTIGPVVNALTLSRNADDYAMLQLKQTSTIIAQLGIGAAGEVVYNAAAGSGTKQHIFQVAGSNIGVISPTGLAVTGIQTVSSSSNGYLTSQFVNTSTGSSAVSRLSVGNNASADAGQIVVYGSNHSTLPNVMDINNANSAALRLLANNTLAATITSSSVALSKPLTIANANATNEITFTGADFTNILSETTSGIQFGINSTSSAYLALLTNNTERARIDSSGNIGVGTTSVSTSDWSSNTTAVQVNNSSGYGALKLTGTGSTTFYLTSGSTANYVWGLSNHPLVVGVNNAESFRLSTGGRLLLGTTTDDGSNLLQVNGKIRTSGSSGIYMYDGGGDSAARGWAFQLNAGAWGNFIIVQSATQGGDPGSGTMALMLNASRYLKATNNGSLTGSTSAYHELYSDTSSAFISVLTHSSTSQPKGINVYYSGAAPNSANANWFFYGEDTGGLRIAMDGNGGLRNYSANNVNLSSRSVKNTIQILADDPRLIRGLWDAHKNIDWCRYKLNDQTHEDFNWGYTAEGVRDAFSKVAPELVDLWDPKSGKRHLAVYDHDLKNISGAILTEAQRRIETLEQQVALLLKRAA